MPAGSGTHLLVAVRARAAAARARAAAAGERVKEAAAKVRVEAVQLQRRSCHRTNTLPVDEHCSAPRCSRNSYVSSSIAQAWSIFDPPFWVRMRHPMGHRYRRSELRQGEQKAFDLASRVVARKLIIATLIAINS